MMEPSPSVGELEIALHRLLSKGRFRGAGHIDVSINGSKASTVTYRVRLSADASDLLLKVLSGIRPDWILSEPTCWVLSTGNAAAIIEAAESKPVYWPLSRAFVRSAMQRLSL
jgi:hypothetical protein